jgi:hypothetical protein
VERRGQGILGRAHHDLCTLRELRLVVGVVGEWSSLRHQIGDALDPGGERHRPDGRAEAGGPECDLGPHLGGGGSGHLGGPGCSLCLWSGRHHLTCEELHVDPHFIRCDPSVTDPPIGCVGFDTTEFTIARDRTAVECHWSRRMTNDGHLARKDGNRRFGIHWPEDVRRGARVAGNGWPVVTLGERTEATHRTLDRVEPTQNPPGARRHLPWMMKWARRDSNPGPLPCHGLGTRTPNVQSWVGVRNDPSGGGHRPGRQDRERLSTNQRSTSFATKCNPFSNTGLTGFG